MCRADSAYYGLAFVGTAIRHHAWFSVTARMTPTVKAAIASIEEDAWSPIKYPHAIWEESEGRWVSDAEVAEIDFTAFTGRRRAEHVTCRLVVRRVKRLQPLASDGTEQGELFATYRHHGRSEEHTSELQSLMRISYAVFCLKKQLSIYNQMYIDEHIV